jgi:hypothetical protein
MRRIREFCSGEIVTASARGHARPLQNVQGRHRSFKIVIPLRRENCQSRPNVCTRNLTASLMLEVCGIEFGYVISRVGTQRTDWDNGL